MYGCAMLLHATQWLQFMQDHESLSPPKPNPSRLDWHESTWIFEEFDGSGLVGGALGFHPFVTSLN